MTFSNTLIDRIVNIREAGESYNNENILKNRKSEIENFRPKFDDIFNKFNVVVATYGDLKCIIPTLVIDIASVKNNCIQLKNKVSQDEYESNIIASIKRELNRIDNELQKVWNVYIAERVGSIAGVLETLGNLISEMPENQVLKIKKNTFTTSAPGSQVAITAITEYISTYNSLMEKLNLSDSVLAFLKLMTSGRTVTLIDMSADVYEWIKTSGFAGKINLKI